MTAPKGPYVTVEPVPHYAFTCSACGPREGLWTSAEDAEWAGQGHLAFAHGGEAVQPVPPSRRKPRLGVAASDSGRATDVDDNKAAPYGESP